MFIQPWLLKFFKGTWHSTARSAGTYLLTIFVFGGDVFAVCLLQGGQWNKIMHYFGMFPWQKPGAGLMCAGEWDGSKALSDVFQCA